VIFVLVGVLVAVVVALLVWPGEREPEYQGKKLSEWIKDANQIWDPEGKRAEAVRQIGTNALPFLVRSIDCGEKPQLNKLETAIGRMTTKHRIGRRAWDAWTDFKWRRIARSNEAAWAFGALGPQGRAAIPELVRLAGSTNEAISIRALNALRGIGEEDAFLALLGFTTDARSEVRSHVKNLIRDFPPEVLQTNAVNKR
jgi:hypothetical protein